MSKVEIVLPFDGFYGSLHEGELDWAVEGMFANNDGSPNYALVNYAYLGIHWRAVMIEYADAYTDALAQEVGVAVAFKELVSPREYNFTTDRIFAEIDETELQRICRITPYGALREVCEAQLTPRDGFIPFYPRDPDDWGPLAVWDHNQRGLLLEAFIAHTYPHETDGYWQVGLMEDARCNEHLADWLFEHSGPQFKRAVRVADYLRKREERA